MLPRNCGEHARDCIVIFNIDNVYLTTEEQLDNPRKALEETISEALKNNKRSYRIEQLMVLLTAS